MPNAYIFQDSQPAQVSTEQQPATVEGKFYHMINILKFLVYLYLTYQLCICNMMSKCVICVFYLPLLKMTLA